MSGRYDDIINFEHPRSYDRAPMNALDRAAQFSPFAALTGYDAIIAENARYTSAMLELDENLIFLLNEKLKKLQSLDRPLVKITYFVPDEKKAGGCYVQKEGRFKKIDSFSGSLIMEDKSSIRLDRIADIEID